MDQGLVKHIGISNFSVKKIKDLLTYARIKPAVNQIEVRWPAGAAAICRYQRRHVRLLPAAPSLGMRLSAASSAQVWESCLILCGPNARLAQYPEAVLRI